MNNYRSSFLEGLFWDSFPLEAKIEVIWPPRVSQGTFPDDPFEAMQHMRHYHSNSWGAAYSEAPFPWWAK
jgi:hypothetical protein